MLDQITPLVLTFDEEANIERTLSALRWAREVLVLDSGSSDATLRLVRSFPNTRAVTRPFDSFASQWNHALRECDVESPWVLALDADHVLTPELIDELANLDRTADAVGYRARFRYCVDGTPLRSSLYPPSTVLFRRERARFIQDGHCQRVELSGSVGDALPVLEHPILHDDRKPFARWLSAQRRYAREEADKLTRTPLVALSWPDRVRLVPFAAPPAVMMHCLVTHGGLLDGRAGLTYAAQRTLAETLLSLSLLRRSLPLNARHRARP
jgi:glycosyltransferase involved in cell wall biosynthesis